MNSRIFAKLAEHAREHNSGFGENHVAAIVFRKQIVSMGFNSKKTHPLQKKFAKNEHAIFLHAEIHAIIKAIAILGKNRLKECDIYVMRLSKDGEVRNSKPCHGCSKAIKEYRFKNVFYTKEEGSS